MSKVIFVVHGMRSGDINARLKSFIYSSFNTIQENYEIAFLESETESLEQVMQANIQQGIRTFYIVPILLFQAKHFLIDIPNVIDSLKREHKDIEVHLSKPIGNHPSMKNHLIEKIKQNKKTDMAVIVLAHGSSMYKEPDYALKELCKDIQNPVYPLTIYGALSYKKYLPDLAKFYSKILIVPYFMFDGFLVNKTKNEMEKMALNTELTYTGAINFDEGMQEAVRDHLKELREISYV